MKDTYFDTNKLSVLLLRAIRLLCTCIRRKINKPLVIMEIKLFLLCKFASNLHLKW